VKKRILITGANGLLGQKLVQLLAQKTDVVTLATARGPNRLPFAEGYQYHEMDITQPEQVAEVMAQLQPDAVIHTAAMTNVDQCEFEKELCWQMNVQAVEYLVDACRQQRSYLCHLSTDFIFDGTSGPYTEEAQASPLSFYGWSKLAGEEVVRRSDIAWGIARTVLVYGVVADMSRSNIILWVKKSLEEGKNIKVVTDQFRSPTLAEDLAQGCWLMTQQVAKGIFNISGKDFLTPYEMALKTADFFGLDKNLITQADSSTFSQPAKRPPRTGFDLSKAQKQLGYAPHSFDEGIGIVAGQVANLQKDT
jgi:dTDP-4-dehydrorhamnose reductase